MGIKNKPNMIQALYGIRALAIILVIFRHGASACVEKFDLNNDSIFMIFMINGWSGVDLFFVLSGFLIGYHLCNQWPKESIFSNNFIRFYIYKRCLRILPVYYAVIGIALLAPSSIYTVTSHNIVYDLGVHSIFLQDYLGARFIVSLWSLASEFKFYILAPFMLICLLKISNKYLLLIALVTIFLVITSQFIALNNDVDFTTYSHFFWEYRAPFHYAFIGLLIGVLLAIVYVRGSIPLWIKNKGNLILVLSLTFIFLMLSYQSYASDHANWILAIVVIAISVVLYAFLIVGAIYSTSKASTILCSAISHFISKISYPLYAIHMLVIPFSLELSNSVLAFSVYYISLSVLSAYVLHIGIEKPFLIFKNRF